MNPGRGEAGLAWACLPVAALIVVAPAALLFPRTNPFDGSMGGTVATVAGLVAIGLVFLVLSGLVGAMQWTMDRIFGRVKRD
jgi:hypothetical protein